MQTYLICFRMNRQVLDIRWDDNFFGLARRSGQMGKKLKLARVGLTSFPNLPLLAKEFVRRTTGYNSSSNAAFYPRQGMAKYKGMRRVDCDADDIHYYAKLNAIKVGSTTTPLRGLNILSLLLLPILNFLIVRRTFGMRRRGGRSIRNEVFRRYSCTDRRLLPFDE